MFERARVHAPLLPVEREREEATALVDPERLVEATAELVGLPVETIRQRLVAPDLPRDLGEPPLCVVDVALHLDGGDRRRRRRNRPGSAASLQSPSTTGSRGLSRPRGCTRRSRRRRDRRSGRSIRARAAPARASAGRRTHRPSSARSRRGARGRAASSRSSRSSAGTTSRRTDPRAPRGRSCRAPRRSSDPRRGPAAR